MVDFQDIGESVSVYPNPINQETFSIEVKRLKAGQQVPVLIISTLGAQTFSKMLTADSNGNIEALIAVDKWARGLYLVHVGTEKGIQRKIIIE
jgi:hypothetical protein